MSELEVIPTRPRKKWCQLVGRCRWFSPSRRFYRRCRACHTSYVRTLTGKWIRL